MPLRFSADYVLLCIFLILIFPIVLFGLFYPDEGYILHTASRLLDGELMYRDFHFVYTPVAAWILAGSFMLFGESVLVGRIAAYLLAVFTSIVLFLIFREYSSKRIWSFLALGVFISWGLFHINFLWPSMVAISCAVTACFFYLRSIKDTRMLIGAGVWSVLVLLSKQNLGVAVIAAIFFTILIEQWTINRRQIRSSLVLYLSGLIGASLLFLIFLLSQGSLKDFLENNYLNLFQKIIVEGTIATPFLYGSGIYSYLKLLFYLSPFLLCIPAVWLSFKNRSSSIVLPIVCAAVYIAGIRPVTDYVHVSPLVSLGCLPIFVLSIFLKKRVFRFFLFSYAVSLVFVGLYLPLFRYYYRWQEPVIEQKYFVNQNRVMVFSEKKYVTEIPALRMYIDSIAGKNEYVYVNYYAPMVYFFLNRRNPTKYDYVSGSGLTDYEHRDIVRNLKEKKVMIAITHAIVQNDTSLPYTYILKHFVMKKRIGDFIIWQRKQL